METLPARFGLDSFVRSEPSTGVASDVLSVFKAVLGEMELLLPPSETYAPSETNDEIKVEVEDLGELNISVSPDDEMDPDVDISEFLSVSTDVDAVPLGFTLAHKSETEQINRFLTGPPPSNDLVNKHVGDIREYSPKIRSPDMLGASAEVALAKMRPKTAIDQELVQNVPHQEKKIVVRRDLATWDDPLPRADTDKPAQNPEGKNLSADSRQAKSPQLSGLQFFEFKENSRLEQVLAVHEGNALTVIDARLQTARSPIGVATQPHAIGQQMLAAVSQSDSNKMDIILRPVELGRIQLSLATNETGLIVHVVAERAETLDLMRRSADVLMKELEGLGHSNIDLSFGQDSTESDKGTNSKFEPPPNSEDAEFEGGARLYKVANDRLDLRI